MSYSFFFFFFIFFWIHDFDTGLVPTPDCSDDDTFLAGTNIVATLLGIKTQPLPPHVVIISFSFLFFSFFLSDVSCTLCVCVCVCVCVFSLSLGYRLGFCTKLQPEAPLNSDERLWEIQVMNESIRLMKQEEERQILAAIEASRKMMTDTAAGVGDHSNAAAPDDDVRSTIREEERQLLAALDDDEGIEKRNDLMEIQAVNDSLRTMMREEEQQLISALEASRLESTGWCNNGGDIVFPDAKKSSRMDDGRVNFPAAKLEDHDDEKAIISIQTAWRVVIAKNKVREEKKARFFNMHRHFGKKRRKKAATRVQAFVRGSLQRRKYMQARLLRSSNHHQEMMMMMMMKTTCHQDDDSMSHHHPYPDKMVKISVPQSSNENEPEDTQRSGSLEATPDSLQSSSSVVTTVSCYDELFFLDGNGDSDRTSDDEVILDQEGSHSCDDDDGENDSDSSSLNLKDDDDFVHVTNTTTSSSSDCDDSFCLIDVDCNFDDNDDKNISDNYNH